MGANEHERRRWNDEGWVAVWPKRERLTDAITPYLLDALALRPGERVLDVGSGGGKATIAAARAVGPDGLRGRRRHLRGHSPSSRRERAAEAERRQRVVLRRRRATRADRPAARSTP